MSYYAVYKGLKPGIYNDWVSCKLQINGFSGAKFKKFKNMSQAEYYVKHGLEKLISKTVEHKKGVSSISTVQGTLLIDSSDDENDDDNVNSDNDSDGDGDDEEETKIIKNNTTDAE